MKLIATNKKHIDSLSYQQLLSHWRFAPIGDPWFQDETGDYWAERMSEIRKQQGDSMHTQASKNIGWQ